MLTILKAWFATRVAPHLPTDEKGQDAAEYALLIGLIAVVLIVGVGALGVALNGGFNALAGTVGGWFAGL
jgi:Flp pilus assembly pilin Flp